MVNLNKRLIPFMLSLAIVSTGFISPISEIFALNGQVATVSAEETITIDSLPSEYEESMDWIWQNRILDEKSTERWNLIFDQIVAGNGTLNYVVRWQSSTALTYEQRQKFEPMIERQINAWTDWLVGFEGWNYNHVDVNIVGWAVSDESLILDKQDDEVIYTTCTTDDLHNSNSDIPELLPYAPTENSRADHFADTNYEYPETRFDMYLWGTTAFQGGAGGDWGQRVSDDYILSVLDIENAHILEHEIGHGFGMTDFYEEYQCPTWPEGTTNIMVAGWAQEITDYDGWMLRYIWDKIKDETNNGVARFNLSQTEPTNPSDTNSWNFDVNNITSLDISIKGESYAGVSGKYYLLDSDGNILSQNDWIMSNSLGENGTDSFNVTIPNDATTLKVEVSSYFVYDSSIGDNKNLNVSTLNISIENIKTQTITPSDILLGDINNDSIISGIDVLTLKRHLLDINPLTDADALKRADLNQDNSVNVIDLCLLKKLMLYPKTDDNNNSDNNDDNNTSFITAPMSMLNGSLPSQGDAKLVIFYIDFPDCTYSTKLTTEEVQEIAFGSADENSANYPFESMSAFYNRSSKGAMNLKGQVFSYTAKNPISYYNDDKVALAEECFEAFKDSTDFSTFDGDGDGLIDATLFTVPSSASDDYWWPCAGGFGDSEYQVDGVKVGHIITGNASPDDSSYYSSGATNFNSSYLHEMGHCLGLPDYYLYYSDDFDSMHGNAGTELMDADAYSDFCSFSKLMLGWYKENQVQVYDSNLGTQTFTLNNAQTDNGNCVIIPYGKLDENYFSEYFIIEYSTDTGNNSNIGADSGIRIHHIKADKYSDEWWSYLKYQNGSEFTNNDDDGIRLIRLVNDGGNSFKTGDIIDNNTSGFGWYDTNEQESINPNVTISIGELQNDTYTITITPID